MTSAPLNSTPLTRKSSLTRGLGAWYGRSSSIGLTTSFLRLGLPLAGVARDGLTGASPLVLARPFREGFLAFLDQGFVILDVILSESWAHIQDAPLFQAFLDDIEVFELHVCDLLPGPYAGVAIVGLRCLVLAERTLSHPRCSPVSSHTLDCAAGR